LHRLLNDGYVALKEKNVGGKIRKYYRITRKGKKALKECKEKIRELVDEVVKEK